MLSLFFIYFTVIELTYNIHTCVLRARGLQKDVVFLGWLVAPSYLCPKGCGVSAYDWVQLYTGAQKNFVDLNPYLTNVCTTCWEALLILDVLIGHSFRTVKGLPWGWRTENRIQACLTTKWHTAAWDTPHLSPILMVFCQRELKMNRVSARTGRIAWLAGAQWKSSGRLLYWEVA